MPGRNGAVEAKRRSAVAALVATERRRLRWRHLVVLAPALVVLTLCGLGVVGSAWDPAARLLAASRHRLSELVPVLVAGYLLAALAAAWAWAGFDARRAALRLPVVVALGAVGIVVLLAAMLIELPTGTGGQGAGGSSAPAQPVAAPTILASALVDRDAAATILGTQVGPPQVRARWLQRGGSLCRYYALDRSATLTVVVRDLPGPASIERLMRRGDPLAGLGDGAVAFAGGVCTFSGDWLLALTARRSDGRPQDRQLLADGARQALALLPR